MHKALRATSVVLILGSLIISATAQTEEETLKVQGRLLAQLSETSILATSFADNGIIAQPADAKAISSPPSSKPGLLTAKTKWIFIGLGSLCGVLISVLIAQWATEVVTWRRQKRKLAQDEACRRHVELYTTDIESPTKPAQLSIFKEEESTAPSAETFCENSTDAATQSQPTTTTTASGIRLPPRVMLRRAPSLRSNFVSVAVRRSTSSREGTPRSPLGHRLGGLGPAAVSIRRTNSSRNPSSMCGSPRSLDCKELTVDSSVKARDVTATGWAPHNHRRSLVSPATSGPATPAASGSPTGAYTLSPGRLIHHIVTECGDGNCSSEDESSNTVGAGADSSGKYPQFGGSAQTGNNKQVLIRMGTDIGLADFKLTTSVAEDEIDENQLIEEESHLAGGHQRERIGIPTRSTSSSGSGGEPSSSTAGGGSASTGLFSAKSIKPKDVYDAANNDNNEGEIQPKSTIAPTAPTLFSARSSSPRTLALTGANVTVLSAEEFTFQVQFLRLLGAGGAGCVHEGLWKGMPVAVKVLHPSRQNSISSVEAFRREVEVMARVGPHPGVIAVLATCLTPPNLAIIVELAEKGSLHSVLHDEGYRPRYGTLLSLAEDIACAVAHCHSLKLVHRALGTASCMAPEQFAAHEVSERCDSYAFGCLLWELITGRQPWEECTNIMQIVMAVGCERRRPPIPPGCPPPLARLIRECWRHNPALRPGFAEIIDRIRQMKREDGAAEAFGAASMAGAGAAAFAGDKGKKFRSLAECILPYSSKPSAQLKPGLSRLAIGSS
ncbi:hypothetical protein Ndes2437B_g05682 [Nannochloris sp. 'desiccata']